MQITVTIADEEVVHLEAFMRKRLLILYPGMDVDSADVIQIMLDDYVHDMCCETCISVARWAIAEATTEAERVAAEQMENDARNMKQANETARFLSRTT